MPLVYRLQLVVQRLCLPQLFTGERRGAPGKALRLAQLATPRAPLPGRDERVEADAPRLVKLSAASGKAERAARYDHRLKQLRLERGGAEDHVRAAPHRALRRAAKRLLRAAELVVKLIDELT